MSAQLGRLIRTDRAGLVLAAAFMIWAVVAGLANARLRPALSPYLLSPLAVVLGVIVGRRLPRVDPRGVTIGITVLIAYVALHVTVRGGAGGGPLGYANANAALAVQLMALSGLLATSAEGWRRRVLLAAVAVSAAAVVITQSRTAMIVSAPLLAAVCVALVRDVRRRWWSVALGVAVIVAAATAVTVMTVRTTWPTVANEVLSTARHTLWHDALTLWSLRPVIGSGPGSFQAFSTLAKDPDTAMAHCSFLQIGAEAGAIGVALFAAIIAVGFALATRGSATATLIASGAWAALAAHSFVDHLLEYPLVVLLAGAVIGLAAARTVARPSEELHIPQGESPLVR